MIDKPSRIVSMIAVDIGLYARKISISVSTTNQIQIEMNNLLLPAKCSSACAFIFAFPPSLVRQMSTDVNRHDVDQRENKHPDEVDEVPVQAADFDVFMFEFFDAGRYDREINHTSCNVKHVQAGNREERRTKQGTRRYAVSSCKRLYP